MRILLCIISLFLPLLLLSQDDHAGHDHAGHDHGGHDHGGGASTEAKATYFSIPQSTERAEYVLHYEPFQAGEKTEMTLYITDWETNAPIIDARLIIRCEELDRRFSFNGAEPGVYKIKGDFPSDKMYEISIEMKAPFEDIVHLNGIEPGKKLEEEEITEEEKPLFTWVVWVFLGLGFLVGMVLTLIIRKRNTSNS